MARTGSKWESEIESGCSDVTFNVDKDVTLDSDSWSIQVANKYPVISAEESKKYKEEIENDMNDVYSYGELWIEDAQGQHTTLTNEKSVTLGLSEDDDSSALAYGYLASAVLVIGSVVY